MRHTKTILIPLIMACGALMLLAQCRKSEAPVHTGQGDTLAMRYATLLQIVKYDGYTTVSIANPWKEGVPLHRYVLVDKHQPLPDHLPEGTVVRTPVERAVIFTALKSLPSFPGRS